MSDTSRSIWTTPETSERDLGEPSDNHRECEEVATQVGQTQIIAEENAINNSQKTLKEEDRHDQIISVHESIHTGDDGYESQDFVSL